MHTRREVIGGGLGLAAIIAAGKAPAAVVRSMCAARGMSIFCGGKEKLPYDAEVEYLEHIASQWFGTSIAPKDGQRWKIGIIKTGSQGDNAILDYQDPRFCPLHAYGGYCIQYGEYQTYGTFNLNEYHDYTTEMVGSGDQRFYIDGEFVHQFTCRYGGGPFDGSVGEVLFNHRQDNRSGIDGRLFYISCEDMMDNGRKRVDLIPVRFTNELGESEGAMYDKVSKKLFRNQGTGSFKFGRDIKPISARSYVQRGLYHRYDAIENGGYGIHDTALNYAVDLAGNNNATYNQSPVLLDKWWRFENTSSSIRNALIVPMDWTKITNEYTIGAVFAWHLPFVSGYIISGSEGGTSMFAPITVSSSGGISTRSPTLYDPAVSGGIVGVDTFCSFCCIYKNGVLSTYLNGVFQHSETVGTGKFYKDYLVVSGDPLNPVEYPCNSSISTVFIHEVGLTADEIATNYSVDKLRFNLP